VASVTLRQGTGLLVAQTKRDAVVSRKASFMMIAVAESNGEVSQLRFGSRIFRGYKL
jgi:hypothetical protein